ncbi:MAG: SAM-dependent methyltransferase [Lachnospiraceae bacterium]|nr:SAM-dependent methyltransferase [Lachnospiraceae bacterium]
MQLSERLQKIISMVTPGLITADIGTDHGYVPIELVSRDIAPRVIAMDVNKGPLKKAEGNIKRAGLSDFIELRLSDGLKNLEKDEAQCVIIAGMGGLLIRRILEDDFDKVSRLKEMILSPHSDIDEVRRFLTENGFVIEKEDMLVEEGKYYTIIKAVRGESDTYSDAELKYGRYLLNTRNKTLFDFLMKENNQLEKIALTLKDKSGEKAAARMQEIRQEKDVIQHAMSYYMNDASECSVSYSDAGNQHEMSFEEKEKQYGMAFEETETQHEMTSEEAETQHVVTSEEKETQHGMTSEETDVKWQA